MRRDKEGHITLIKGTIFKGDITILNIRNTANTDPFNLIKTFYDVQNCKLTPTQ